MSRCEVSASVLSDAEQLFGIAAQAGIHRLSLPTPFLVGRVNCYLLDDEPLTLIDTGPNSGRSLDELERALAAHGRAIEDLELIVITHQHMDHLGLLEILARRSGAEVAALEQLAPYLADFSRSAADDDEFAQAIMRRHGIPEELSLALASAGAAFRAFGSSGHVTRKLPDGDELTLRDRRLRVLHRPGHSPSDTVFVDEERQIMIAGDHLLARISSNPLLSRPLGVTGAGGSGLDGEGVRRSEVRGSGVDGSARPRALVRYIESLRATRELSLQLVLPGHGDPIVEHAALIDERLRMHHRRARKVLLLLDDGPLTAYEIALRMWGNVALTQAFLTLSEVLGHLDLLVAEGAVREYDDGDVARFEAV